ncbi:MAG: CbiX/SirB N-terminal domain-containing protein [Synechococcaceae cyanobacterium]|nr:CbiX/SirB N-terminal domain-containing protein [Synechococcaceae cyanobacterium]
MLSSPRPFVRVAPPPGLDPPPDPGALPPPTHPARWAFLQRLRGPGPLALEAWLAAIEAGALDPLPDLLAALAPRLDGPQQARLLRWWLASPAAAASLPAQVVQQRDPALAALLRQALADGTLPEARQASLLPLLGHQRDRTDFPTLRAAALAPRPTPLRRAALEGLCLGLSAWPLAPLRRTLHALALDLDPPLAATAIDALARLPEARRDLLPLRQRALLPALAERLERRLRALPASPLLLVVHGRAGGVVPQELAALAAALAARRGAPVWLRALTEPEPAPVPRGARPLLVVPLLLLPGGHARRDLPALVAALRREGPVRCWPFLGAWPHWQQALAAEIGARAPDDTGPPLLLHHPLEGPLAARYLRHLEQRCGALCRPAPYSSADPEELALTIHGPVLPLALAANRLTEALQPRLGEAAAPLLERPRLREALLRALEALP